MLKENQTIILYRNDGVICCGKAKSILEAYQLLQEWKQDDKKYWEDYECKGKMPKVDYYFELEEEIEDKIYTSCVTIYKKGKKIFMKTSEYPD